MKSFIILLLFVGMFMIIHGIYEQKLKELQDNPRVEYKFVPRSYYDEQLSLDESFGSKFKSMFNHASPWFDRTVGEGLDAVKTDATPKK